MSDWVKQVLDSQPKETLYIFFWRKSDNLSLTNSAGLTKEQVEELRKVEVGDRLVLTKMKQVLITDPNFKLSVVKK